MRTIHQMYTDNICIIYKAVGVVEDVQNRLLSSNMLMICIDGELELSIDSSPALKMGTSNMAFIPKGSVYSVKILQPTLEYPWIGYYILFDLNVHLYQMDISDMLQFPNRVSLQGDSLQQAINAYWNILGCHEDNSLISELKCKAFPLELFCMFLQTYGDPTQIEKYDQRLLDLAGYIGEHYNEADITLESLAQAANMHSSSLIRLFKEQTGLTPMRFVNRTRLVVAKRMLLYSNKSIKEIAVETGFGEQQSFVRSLRQDTGLTPSDFRRAMNYEEADE